MISKSDLLGSVAVAAKGSSANGGFNIRADAITFLKTLSASFERIQFVSVVIEYKPAAAMTQAGLVTFGVDWNWSAAKTTRTAIAAYEPNATCAVWKPAKMKLPSSRLQSRLWYSTATTAAGLDAGPCIIAWAADAGNSGSAELVLGECWIHYKVRLAGTTS